MQDNQSTQLNIFDKISSELNIFEVVSEFVHLEKQGKSYVGLCPFHEDSTPSFHVNTEKNICKCFACGVGGSPIAFYANIKKLEPMEALKELASKYKLELPASVSSFSNPLEKNYKMLNLISEMYQVTLKNSESGKDVYKYLLERGYSKELVDELGLGFAQSINGVTNYLRQKQNLSDEEIVSLGLAYESNGSIRDSFQNRLIIPIKNEKGEVVGFCGRTLSKDSVEPKYLLGRETATFKKFRVLFNLDKARDEIIKNNNELYIVEGFFDSFRLTSLGIKNNVALMGTALTKEHVETIKKLNCNVTLFLDNDEAGIKASIKNAKILEDNNILAKIVMYSGDNKDPDEILINEVNFHKILDETNKDTVYEYALNKLAENKDLSEIDQLLFYKKSMEELLSNSDRPIKEKYQEKVLKELGINLFKAEYTKEEQQLINKIGSSYKKDEFEKLYFYKPLEDEVRKNGIKLLSIVLYHSNNNIELATSIFKKSEIYKAKPTSDRDILGQIEWINSSSKNKESNYSKKNNNEQSR